MYLSPQANQVREGVTKSNAAIFNPILRGFCWQDRIGEVTSMVLEKMFKLGCVPTVFSYNILIKGLCSIRAKPA
jgi:pentatricopeptide repeat protein